MSGGGGGVAALDQRAGVVGFCAVAGETVATTDPVSGEQILRVPLRPLPMVNSEIAFRSPAGREKGELW